MWKMFWHFQPYAQDHPARIIQSHFSITNIPEQTFLVLRAYGHKISPCL
jgi:hypothetical protein